LSKLQFLIVVGNRLLQRIAPAQRVAKRLLGDRQPFALGGVRNAA
jgi:hypothetical protein